MTVTDFFDSLSGLPQLAEALFVHLLLKEKAFPSVSLRGCEQPWQSVRSRYGTCCVLRSSQSLPCVVAQATLSCPFGAIHLEGGGCRQADGGIDSLPRQRKPQPLSHGCAVPAPLAQGSLRAAHSSKCPASRRTDCNAAVAARNDTDGECSSLCIVSKLCRLTSSVFCGTLYL